MQQRPAAPGWLGPRRFQHKYWFQPLPPPTLLCNSVAFALALAFAFAFAFAVFLFLGLCLVGFNFLFFVDLVGPFLCGCLRTVCLAVLLGTALCGCFPDCRVADAFLADVFLASTCLVARPVPWRLPCSNTAYHQGLQLIGRDTVKRSYEIGRMLLRQVANSGTLLK